MNLYQDCSKTPRRSAGLKWYVKLFIFIAVAALTFAIAGMGYVVRAKYAMNDYVIHLGAAFNAATLVNAATTHTDEGSAVIAEYQGQRAVIVLENYKALQSYLRRDYAMPPFARIDRDEALHVSICGASHLYIISDKDGQGATLEFESAGERFVMHVSGGDLWQKIIDICLKGFGKNANIPLADSGQ